ncbi:protein-L-isoaspartate O-methyltransferase [Haloferax elongans ATCC BAA-1513]|uniref:Protein-L-isoaspartate O-methyltransferase n=1 Tax=Haloferax elongans ATCC BAA-1513 TaxID=1230453 RepID=M0HLG1_HALEO|nr:class I SAM-dependent methyltransferase [Haloferax elongans]ELZ84628.1 protein-L-isoaspartate O-methyltransferase [Haloferax elongans ATCC BAA-1513]
MSESHDSSDEFTPQQYDDASAAYEEYQTCLSYIGEHGAIERDDIVVDIGTGTGNLALELAPKCELILGRDIDDEWLQYAQEKAAEQGVENISFDHGSFREPNVDEPVDVVVTSYAFHAVYHEGGEEELRAAIEGISSLNPRYLVVADRMIFGPRESHDGYDKLPTMGTVSNLLVDAGFRLVDVEPISASDGVLVATRTSR